MLNLYDFRRALSWLLLRASGGLLVPRSSRAGGAALLLASHGWCGAPSTGPAPGPAPPRARDALGAPCAPGRPRVDALGAPRPLLRASTRPPLASGRGGFGRPDGTRARPPRRAALRAADSPRRRHEPPAV